MNEEEQMFYQMCAAVAMKAIVQVHGDSTTVANIANQAFDQADAMLAELRVRMDVHAAEEADE